MVYPHRQGTKASTSESKRTVKVRSPPCSSAVPVLAQAKQRRYTSEQNITSSVQERSVRHADIILRRSWQSVLLVPAASRLVPLPAGRRRGLLGELGGEMAQTLARRTGGRRSARARPTRPLASTQDPSPHHASAGGRADPRHSRSASRRLAPCAGARSNPLLRQNAIPSSSSSSCRFPPARRFTASSKLMIALPSVARRSVSPWSARRP